jgi:hypothetical protein
LKNLTARREDWESGFFRSSNRALYAILGDCLKLYYRVSTHAEGFRKVQMAVIKHLEENLAGRGIRSTKDTHLATKIVRYVFSTDRKRACAYSIVIRSAISEKVAPDAMVEFIEDRGGIEEIRLKTLIQTTDAPHRKVEERIEQSAARITSAPKLGTLVGMSDASVAQVAMGPGLRVALVEVDSSGQLAVKWIGDSKGAIRLALLACASGQGVVRSDILPATGETEVAAANDPVSEKVA